MKAPKVPIAFDPPPTQAMTRSGRRPVRSRICARASSPIDALELAHDRRIGRRPDRAADDVVRARRRSRPSRGSPPRPPPSASARPPRRVPRARRAAPCAGRLAAGGGCPPRPCRRRSRARAARQRWPPPPRAARRPSRRSSRGLPMRFASSACPRALLSLCDPVWLRSSRLRNTGYARRGRSACAPHTAASGAREVAQREVPARWRSPRPPRPRPTPSSSSR
jgi:hypothetical protein